MQPDQHDPGRFIQVEGRSIPTQQLGQFIVKDFNDLLPGRDAPQHLLSERPTFNPRDEILGNLKVNVGFEQRQSYLAQCIIDVALRDRAMTPEVFENILKFIR